MGITGGLENLGLNPSIIEVIHLPLNLSPSQSYLPKYPSLRVPACLPASPSSTMSSSLAKAIGCKEYTELPNQ